MGYLVECDICNEKFRNEDWIGCELWLPASWIPDVDTEEDGLGITVCSPSCLYDLSRGVGGDKGEPEDVVEEERSAQLRPVAPPTGASAERYAPDEPVNSAADITSSITGVRVKY